MITKTETRKHTSLSFHRNITIPTYTSHIHNFHTQTISMNSGSLCWMCTEAIMSNTNITAGKINMWKWGYYGYQKQLGQANKKNSAAIG